MDIESFHYQFPRERIAQYPLPEREASRMMVLHRSEKKLQEGRVADLPRFLREGDLLVFNDTRVFPARLKGEDEKERNVEILLLEPLENGNGEGHRWRCLAKPLKKINVGSKIRFSKSLHGVFVKKEGLDVEILLLGENVVLEIEKTGLTPLPPYIRRSQGVEEPKERERYQSIFAKETGSAAAPTASLHFSENLMKKINARGVQTAFVTLHISSDTFLPIRTPNIMDHKMHGERFFIPQETQSKIEETRRKKGRVIAVGTTVVRALESDWREPVLQNTGGQVTHLYIYPGFRFRWVDGILTNFHQPKSTLLLLVCAFAEREFLLEAYGEAVKKGYRLFSYGDSMLIL